MTKVEASLTAHARSVSIESRARQKDPQKVTKQSSTPKQPKMLSRETYEALQRLSDDGCPLVVDLEDYEIGETSPAQTTKAPSTNASKL